MDSTSKPPISQRVSRPPNDSCLFNPVLSVVRAMCKIMPSDAELATMLGVSTQTIKHHKKTNEPFAQAIDDGKADGRSALRRRQYEVALMGDPRMLIWLGKQELSQRDGLQLDAKVEMDVEATISSLSDDDFKQALADLGIDV